MSYSVHGLLVKDYFEFVCGYSFADLGVNEDCECIADGLWDIEYSALFTVDVVRVYDQIA
jgi:hypothetical protein